MQPQSFTKRLIPHLWNLCSFVQKNIFLANVELLPFVFVFYDWGWVFYFVIYSLSLSELGLQHGSSTESGKSGQYRQEHVGRYRSERSIFLFTAFTVGFVSILIFYWYQIRSVEQGKTKLRVQTKWLMNCLRLISLAQPCHCSLQWQIQNSSTEIQNSSFVQCLE